MHTYYNILYWLIRFLLMGYLEENNSSSTKEYYYVIYPMNVEQRNLKKGFNTSLIMFAFKLCYPLLKMRF